MDYPRAPARLDPWLLCFGLEQAPMEKATKRWVLIVEDEPLIRLSAVDHFEEAGFDVLEAESGEAALSLLGCHDLAALFTDVDLNGKIDGFHLARIARRDQPDTFIVLVSGACSAEDGDMPEGATFLSKPYDLNALITSVNRIIGQKE